MRINGIDLKPLGLLQRRVLVALGLSYPGPISTEKLIEIVWPDPDLEPEHSRAGINQIATALRSKRLNGWTVPRADSRGYRLEKVER